MNVTLLNTINLDDGTFIKKGGGTKLNNQEKTIDIRENGTYDVFPDSDYTGLSKVTANVAIGEEQVYYVNYRHYDGTILYRYTKEEFLALNESPAGQNFEGLIFKGWNWQLAEAQDYIKDFPVDFEIGAIYDTEDNTINVFLDVKESCELVITDPSTCIKKIDWGNGDVLDVPSSKEHSHILNKGIYKIRLYAKSSFSYSMQLGRSLFEGDAVKYITGIEFPSNIYIDSRSDYQNGWLSPCVNLQKILYNGTLRSLIGSGEEFSLFYVALHSNAHASMIYDSYIPSCQIVSLGSAITQNISFYGNVPKNIVCPPNLTLLLNSKWIDKLYGKNIRILSYTNPFYVKHTNAIFQNSNINTTEKIVHVENSVNHKANDNVETIIVTDKSTSCSITGNYIQNVFLPSNVTSYKGVLSFMPVNVYIENLDAYVQKFSDYWSYRSVTLYLNNEVFTGKNMSIGAVTSIANNVFRNVKHLEQFMIPSSVTKIGKYAFYGCESLTSITIPDSVTSIGSSAFSGCTSLKTITIPNNMTTIAEYTFNNTGITRIVIPSNILTIDTYSFGNCRNLQSIIFEEGLQQLTGPFCSDCLITELQLPDSLTTIKSSLCKRCRNLQIVKFGKNISTLPSTLIEIAPLHITLDFSECIQIPSISSSSFMSSVYDYSIVVPDSLYDQWIVATNWSKNASKIIKKSDWDAQNA